MLMDGCWKRERKEKDRVSLLVGGANTSGCGNWLRNLRKKKMRRGGEGILNCISDALKKKEEDVVVISLPCIPQLALSSGLGFRAAFKRYFFYF